MKRILLLSDTHSYIDDRILDYAKDADEVWHCGDFGNMNVIEELEKIKPIRGVYGNIDEAKIRTIFPEVLSFKCEDVDVLMIHIGGYPDKYSPLAKKEIAEKKPKLFISGHSHILTAMFDKKINLLPLNPGLAGKSVGHKLRTMIVFTNKKAEIKDSKTKEPGCRV